ncbi:MAG: phosphomannose isomerase type II C-terminal cupin domain [Candidatus Woesearchaeota archaeon]
MILKNKKHIEKPWGFEEQLTLNEETTVKILVANPGEELSYQTHEHRDEFWMVLSDEAVVVLNDEEKILKKNDTLEVFKGDKHQLKGGLKGSTILEISTGGWDADDITRLKDKYNR